MKKEYKKPATMVEIFVTGPILLETSNMGSNETPGGDDAFNAGANRGEWGTLWKSGN